MWFPAEQPNRAAVVCTNGSQGNLLDRAGKYLAKMPGAISGQHGHNATFHAACVLVLGFELSADDALALLANEYNPRCRPPWTEGELRHKVNDAARQGGPRGYLRDAVPAMWHRVNVPHYSNGKPVGQERPKLPPNLLAEHLTDVGNGRRFVAMHGATVRYCFPWEKWLIWDSMRWLESDRGQPEEFAKQTCRALLYAAGEETKTLAHTQTDSEEKEARGKYLGKVQSFALKSESSGRIASMIGLARSEPSVPVLPEQLNTHSWLLCCPNGIIDLQTGALCEHDPSDYITHLCPTEFDSEATCPLFCRFLEEVLGSTEMVTFMQRLMGYSLTGETCEHIMPIFWGSGSNGKSTLLGTWIHVLGNDYAGKAPASLFVQSRNERHPTELASLFGKRLIVATETEKGARLAESTVKELTGGDRITARRMREDFWTFEATHKLVLATNNKPRIRGRDYAIWRRLKLIPFVRRFDDATKDKAMLDKLKREATGILAWMVRGCLGWQRDGLSEPEAVTLATVEYRSEEDVLDEWILDCCATGSDEKSKASELYDSYKRWSERSGDKNVMTSKRLYAELRDSGFDEYRNDGLWFDGIGLRQNAIPM